MPLSVRLFSRYRDRGFVFSKALGLYVCGYLMWFLSSCHILKYRTVAAVLCVVLVGTINYLYVYLRFKKGDNYFVEAIKSARVEIVLEEVVFLLLFIGINWLFAHRVQSFATERMMDYGFMVSISKADYMPAKDIWAAGCNINYYYFGQYIFTYIQKIAGVTVGHAYTFGMYGIMVWMLLAVYRIAEGVAESRIAGVISAAVTTLGGNLHYVVYKYIVPIVWEMLGNEGDAPHYWFADATRYIGYNPEIEGDKTIHEFPMYSFIIGDLHAHVTNILIVVLIVALLWAWLQIEKNKDAANEPSVYLAPQLIMTGFMLAICNMANYWDFPIYYIVAGSVVLFGLIYAYGMCKKTVVYVGFDGVLILLLAIVLSLPFNLSFEKMVNGIGIASMHSKLYQLIVLWGFPVALVVLFVIMLLKEKLMSNRHLFIMLLGLCATGLVIIPELIFVKDIYISGYPRANTMFKLTFQAFILYGIITGCIVVELARMAARYSESYKGYIYKKKTVICALFCVLAVGFCPVALKMWFNDGGDFKYISMDASYKIREKLSYQLEAIEWLEEQAVTNDEKQPVVLTSDGDSYSENCAVSVLTGFPTVLGWHTHEWLWHNSREFYEERCEDVKEIYTGINFAYSQELLKKYDVKYIFIGPDEYEKYDAVQTDFLEGMGEIVYSKVCETGQLIEIIKVY